MSSTENSAVELSVIVPVYNESENLQELFLRIRRELSNLEMGYEIICVDDGSTDNSAELIRKEETLQKNFRGLYLKENFGQQAALLQGLRQAKGKFCITLDGDLQNPPEEIPRLLALLRRGNDLVGTRRENRKDPIFRRACSRIANFWLGRILSEPLVMHDYGCMLRGYSAELLQRTFPNLGAKFYLPINAMSAASSPVEIEVKHAARERGMSKYRSAFALLRTLFLMVNCAKKVREERAKSICTKDLP